MLTNPSSDRECEILYKADLQQDEIIHYINTIKEKNETLAIFIKQGLCASESAGIRLDVLHYLSENIDNIPDTQDYIFNIANLINHTELSPKWFAWINEYINQMPGFSMDDFMTLLVEALDKNIPFEKVKEIFEQGKNDMLSAYEAIAEHKNEQPCPELDTVDTDIPQQFLKEESSKPKVVQSAIAESYNEQETDITGVFNSMLSVISNEKANTNELAPVYEHLSNYAVSMQNFVNDINSYAGKIVNDWQRDRDENKRLRSLYDLQQKLLLNQQNKINEMRDEIMRLNVKLQEAEKSALHQEAINRKINELKSMTDSDADGKEYVLYSGKY